MHILKRVLFLPALILGTIVAGLAVQQYPDRLTYGALAIVMTLWALVALRSVILVGKVVAFATLMVTLVGVYLGAPYVLAWLNR